MARFFSHTTLLCLLLLLTSCREEALISPKDLQFLQQGILTTTWTENYIRHTEQVDTLYINPMFVVLEPGGETWSTYDYDGQFHGDDLGVSIECDEGDYSLENLGGGHWKISFKWGDEIDVYISGGGVDVGQYPLTVDWEGDTANYAINVNEEGLDLVIYTTLLDIRTESASKPYDGTPLTCYGLNTVFDCVKEDENVYRITLVNGETITVTITGSQTAVGSSGNTISRRRKKQAGTTASAAGLSEQPCG